MQDHRNVTLTVTTTEIAGTPEQIAEVAKELGITGKREFYVSRSGVVCTSRSEREQLDRPN